MELATSILIGIFTSIIGSILINLTSSIIFKRRQKLKYIEDVKRANNEIIEILKPYIAEKGLPKEEIVLSIIYSISRKYGVHERDLYSINIFCQELIKDIINNVYLSSDKKEEYSIELANYLNNVNFNLTNNQIEKENKNVNKKNAVSIKKNINFILLTSVFIIGLIIIIVYFIKNNDFQKVIEYKDTKLFLSIFISFVSTVISYITGLVIVFIPPKYKRKRENKNKNKISK
ncbi:hypothetical protein R4J18_04795 [Brachyspira pilosicoli]|uniref:hypothetical protein n=1 Tax=Brachyspira pilosicoli TaxID=52584 RepID=UPI0030057E25